MDRSCAPVLHRAERHELLLQRGQSALDARRLRQRRLSLLARAKAFHHPLFGEQKHPPRLPRRRAESNMLDPLLAKPERHEFIPLASTDLPTRLTERCYGSRPPGSTRACWTSSTPAPHPCGGRIGGSVDALIHASRSPGRDHGRRLLSRRGRRQRSAQSRWRRRRR